jgi:hypothetical protein
MGAQDDPAQPAGGHFFFNEALRGANPGRQCFLLKGLCGGSGWWIIINSSHFRTITTGWPNYKTYN